MKKGLCEGAYNAALTPPVDIQVEGEDWRTKRVTCVHLNGFTCIAPTELPGEQRQYCAVTQNPEFIKQGIVPDRSDRVHLG